MDTSKKQQGYDDNIFVTEPAKYLRCAICSLVMKNALQLLPCGHRFCSACFRGMKPKNGMLRCPTDHNVIDLCKLHDDLTSRRIVGNLSVRCRSYAEGCVWTGKLEELENHITSCSFQKQSKPDEKEDQVAEIVSYMGDLQLIGKNNNGG